MVRTKLHIFFIVGLLIAIVAFGTFFVSRSEAFQTSPDTTYLCAPENAFSRNTLSTMESPKTTVQAPVLPVSQVIIERPAQVSTSKPVLNTSGILTLLGTLRQIKEFTNKYPSFQPASAPKPTNELIDSYIRKLENALERGWTPEDANLENRIESINSVYTSILNEYKSYQSQQESISQIIVPSFEQPAEQRRPVLTLPRTVKQTSIQLTPEQQTQVTRLRQQIIALDNIIINPSISREQFRNLLRQRITFDNQLRDMEQPTIPISNEVVNRLRSGK